MQDYFMIIFPYHSNVTFFYDQEGTRLSYVDQCGYISFTKIRYSKGVFDFVFC